MNLALLQGLPPGLRVIALAAHLVLGVGAGMVFFRSLLWNTRLIVGGGPLSTALALTLGRFLGLGGLLTLAALEGAMPLLATALGVFIGRFFVLRAAKLDAP